MATNQERNVSFTNLQGFIPATQRESSVDLMWGVHQTQSSVEPSVLRLARERRESSVATPDPSSDVEPLRPNGF